MERHYGVKPGMRGTHWLTGDQLVEVVHTDFTDNNRAQYRIYGGDQNGEEFDATAEHFTESPKDKRCPGCGMAVYSVFDHIDMDC